MLISAKKFPASRPQPLALSFSSAPPSRLQNSFMSGLHNFDIPFPLTWGRHQVLRCLNINRRGEIITPNRTSNLIEPSANFPEQLRLDETHISISDNPSFEEGKTKFQVQLHDAAFITDNINQSKRDHQSDDLLGHLPDAPPVPISVHIPSSNSPSIVTRPCNQRIQRVPIRKIPCGNACAPPPPPPLRKSVRKRSIRLMSDNLEKRDYFPKIRISLSRKEIKEDFYTMVGSPPSRRPKKRPRVIQKQLDELLPGSLLSSITPSSYRVPD